MKKIFKRLTFFWRWRFSFHNLTVFTNYLKRGIFQDPRKFTSSSHHSTKLCLLSKTCNRVLEQKFHFLCASAATHSQPFSTWDTSRLYIAMHLIKSSSHFYALNGNTLGRRKKLLNFRIQDRVLEQYYKDDWCADHENVAYFYNKLALLTTLQIKT